MPSWRNNYASIEDVVFNCQMIQKPIVHYMHDVINNIVSSSQEIDIYTFFSKIGRDVRSKTIPLAKEEERKKILNTKVILKGTKGKSETIGNIMQAFYDGQEQRTWFKDRTTIQKLCEEKGRHYAHGVLVQFSRITDNNFPYNFFAEMRAHPGSDAYLAAKEYIKSN